MNEKKIKDMLAKEILSLGVAEAFAQSHPIGKVKGTVTRYHLALRPEDRVPYEGADARTRKAFSTGFIPSYGSGLAFKGLAESGALEFFGLTDRGPNGEAPQVPAPEGDGLLDAKFFPAPSFVPSVGIITVDASGARLSEVLPLMVRPNVAACGLPYAPGRLGSSGEVPLLDSLRYEPASKAVFSDHGVDSEAIAWDSKRRVLWIGDEYGPFLVKVDPGSGLLLERYGPGTGLPPVFALRRSNRGMEGMSWDAGSDRVHAFLQSPLSDGRAVLASTGKKEKIERHARFVRWIEFNPATGSTSRMFAFPLDPDQYQDGYTGNAKLGDMVALGGGKFIVIEQGAGPDGQPFNQLVLVDIAGATNIAALAFNPDSSDLEQSSMAKAPVRGADWSAVVPLQKRLLLDLNAMGWVADKAEGLALADDFTLAVSSDSDFGLKTQLETQQGKKVRDVDITELQADADGKLPGYRAWVGRAEARDRANRLWILRFKQALSGY